MGGLGRYQCVRPLIHPIPPPFHASYVLFSKLSPALWPFFPFFFFCLIFISFPGVSPLPSGVCLLLWRFPCPLYVLAGASVGRE